MALEASKQQHASIMMRQILEIERNYNATKNCTRDEMVKRVSQIIRNEANRIVEGEK